MKMTKLSSAEIRRIWINFFKKKGHYHIESASLIPQDDPTLLWINAGITPLKKYFNGHQDIVYKKIVNIQKCLRTNDIENVGQTSIHHTFFEMLGNFSIGDYFKQTAIDLAYDLLISSSEGFCLDVQKIYITYHYTDQETCNLWLKKGILSNHLIPLKNNFWHIGSGPCGPCTEIFFDRGIKYHKKGKELLEQEIPNDRFIEIWNIVFSQYYCSEEIKNQDYQILLNKNIDTGAGLERLACVLQEVEDTFATDLFKDIIAKISCLSSVDYRGQEAFKVIADHVRSLVFALSDGVIFSNDGRGYILKKILRRAIQKGKLLNFHQPFLYQLVFSVIQVMKFYYPSLQQHQFFLEKMIHKEEQKFFKMLKNVEEKIFISVQNNVLKGEDFFKLYDTYGVPKEIILEYCYQKGFLVDIQGFETKIALHKNLSRSKQIFKLSNNVVKIEELLYIKDKQNKKADTFVGYHDFEIKTKVVKILDEGIILEKTPFYPKMGGQISDEGWINEFSVLQVLNLPNGSILHKIKGNFFKNQIVVAKINVDKRNKVSLHHTATHLLYDTMRLILGQHVEQKGSFIDSNSFTFDFNHYEKIDYLNLVTIEKKINHLISRQMPITIKEILFTDVKKNVKINYVKNKQYPEYVRLVDISGYSLALCAGTHAQNTKDLHKFIILSCELISSGIYRIEAIAGNHVLPILQKKINIYLNEKQNILNKINNLELPNLRFSLSVEPEITGSYRDIINYQIHLKNIQKQFKNLQKTSLLYQKQFVFNNYSKFIPSVISTNMILFIDFCERNIELVIWKSLLEHIFSTLNIDILLLCYSQNGMLFFMCRSKKLNADQVIQQVSQISEGIGGGKAHFAQGSSKQLVSYSKILEYWNQNFL